MANFFFVKEQKFYSRLISFLLSKQRQQQQQQQKLIFAPDFGVCR